jgi:hypothetical protein
VSVVALDGMTFDLATPHGRMMATVLAGISEFERELIQERIRSGIAAAKARGKVFGRKPGGRPKSDRLASKVMVLVAKGRSYRLIGREVGLTRTQWLISSNVAAPTRLNAINLRDGHCYNHGRLPVRDPIYLAPTFDREARRRCRHNLLKCGDYRSGAISPPVQGCRFARRVPAWRGSSAAFLAQEDADIAE